MGNNIAIPYTGRIPGGIRDGSNVVITGSPLINCNRFSINLCVGPNSGEDRALHFNPRISENTVVRNHMQRGSWGKEERNGGCPFQKGQMFEIRMNVDYHRYSISVNNRHFCDFEHRIPKENVQFIYIEGDVIINSIHFTEGFSHSVAPDFPAYPPAPSGFRPTPEPPLNYQMGVKPYPGMAGGPFYNPPVPFTAAIPGGLFPGKILYISGIPRANPSRFTVNLQCGSHQSGDVALHFDSRFNYGNDRNQVIRTHKQNGSYGQEERSIPYFPFTVNVPFEMMILTDPSSFKIAVNNQHFVEFYHRIQPFSRADHLNVNGDVTLRQIRFQ